MIQYWVSEGEFCKGVFVMHIFIETVMFAWCVLIQQSFKITLKYVDYCCQYT